MHAVKHDHGKPPLSLLSRSFLTGVADVLAFGARKYDRHNWRQGMEYSRLADAALRHIVAWIDGEECDPESGLSHLHHAACCLMFLSEYQEYDIGDDDRYKREFTL